MSAARFADFIAPGFEPEARAILQKKKNLRLMQVAEDYGKMLGEPILIIKAAWGGKSLHTDFRPPSAGP